jgi:GDSL-like Lipase/Acylhydrolase family
LDVLRPVLKLVVITTSLLLSLAAGEIYVRVFRGDLVDSNVLRERLKEGSIAHLIRPTTSPGLVYELIPNNSGRLLASQIVTGPGGYRIDPDAAPAATDARGPRIAFVGDSTSFGWGVEYRQSYPEIFRSRLAADLGIPVELRNYSVPGYNSEQEFALFQQRVVPYKPDLVVVHHDPNDADPVGLGFGMTPEYLAPEYGDNVLSSKLLKLVLRAWRIRQNDRAFTYDRERQTVLAGAFVGGTLHDRHIKALESFASTATPLDLPVVVVLFNGRVAADEHYKDSEIYQVLHLGLQQRLEGMGFFVLDLFPFYQERMRQEGWKDLTPVWRSPGDAHPNPAGHRMLADAVMKYVMSKPELVSKLTRRPD